MKLSVRDGAAASARSVMGVRIQPVATVFKRMPCGPASMAGVLVSWTTAALVTP